MIGSQISILSRKIVLNVNGFYLYIYLYYGTNLCDCVSYLFDILQKYYFANQQYRNSKTLAN